MTTVSRGMTKGEADQAASRAAYFSSLLKKEQIRSEQVAAEEKAKAPITISLGANSLTLSDDQARSLGGFLQANLDAFAANPDGVFTMPDGSQATGAQLQAALGTLILTGKV